MTVPHTTVQAGDRVELIRAIIFREGDLWVGQCVEYDIGAQARTLAELHKKLEITILVELDQSMNRYGVPFKGIPVAPAHVGDMWNRRAGTFQPAGGGAMQVRHQVQSFKVGLELALHA